MSELRQPTEFEQRYVEPLLMDIAHRRDTEAAKKVAALTDFYDRAFATALEREAALEQELDARMKGAWALQDRVTVLEQALRIAAPYVYQTNPPTATRQADAKTVHAALGGDGNQELGVPDAERHPEKGSEVSP